MLFSWLASMLIPSPFPALCAVQQAELSAAVATACGGDAACGGSSGAAAAETLPYLRLFAAATRPGGAHAPLCALPPRRSAAPGAPVAPPRRAPDAGEERDVYRGARNAAAGAADVSGADADELDDPVED
jgi:hypothetical protein